MDSRNKTSVAIIDPVCGMSRGHNLPTVRKYRSFFARNGVTVVGCHVCRTLSPTHDLVHDLSFNYASFLPPDRPSLRTLVSQSIAGGLGRSKFREVSRIFVCFPFLHFLALRAAIRDIRALLRKYPTSVQFFYPGVDFYTLYALRILAAEGTLRGRRFHLRFMGVMETAGFIPIPDKTIQIVLRDIVRMAPEEVRFTAETEKLARLISAVTAVEVPVTSIPVEPSPHLHLKKKAPEISPSSPLVLGCLGGARADKGYNDLPHLAHRLYATFGLSVRLLIQSMHPSQQCYSKDVQDALVFWPNVDLLPPVLSDAAFVEAIHQCDALVLPYSKGTYEYRGSAMLFDGLAMGKPVFGMKLTGFGESISVASAGFTFDSIDHFVALLSDQLKTRQTFLRALDEWAEAGRAYLGKLEKNLICMLFGDGSVRYLY